jgi:hypothetical protein
MSHWTGAAIILKCSRTKTYIVTRRKTSTRPMLGGVKLPLGLAELGLIDEYEFEPRSLRRVRPQGQLPMQRKTFGAVLKHIVQDLEPGREYTEKQINTLLKRRHPDTASLRRGIDFRLMERKSGRVLASVSDPRVGYRGGIRAGKLVYESTSGILTSEDGHVSFCYHPSRFVDLSVLLSRYS